MAEAQVTCINKQPRENPYERITHLGGATWKWTRESVIQSIEDGTNTFFTNTSGQKTYIGVVDGPHGKYLRTHANGTWNDNLLSLPECR